MNKWSVVLCLAHALAADLERAASSLEKQSQSVERQVRRYRQPGSFFLSPWLAQNQPESLRAAPASGDCEPLPDASLTRLIAAAARESGVRPQLLRAVIRRESGGRPCALSPRGAQGLMQLMPSVQQELGVTDPFDPASSLSGGARYLSDLLKRYKGDLRRTLAAYNAGPQKVGVNSDLPDIPETRAFVDTILSDLERQQFPDPDRELQTT